VLHARDFIHYFKLSQSNQIPPNVCTSLLGDPLEYNPEIPYYHENAKDAANKKWVPGKTDKVLNYPYETSTNEVLQMQPSEGTDICLDPVWRIVLSQPVDPSQLAKVTSVYVWGKSIGAKIAGLFSSQYVSEPILGNYLLISPVMF